MTKSRKLVIVPTKAKKKNAKQQNPTVSSVGKALRALGGAGGAALGAYLGQPIAGGSLGTSLGAAVSRWLGQGDYTVSANSVVGDSLKASASVPYMHKDGQSIIVRHKEYLGEIRSSTTYAVQNSFVLNPGNPVTFPWLSDIAAKFQEYTLRGAVFHYIPSSGNAVSSTNPALGTVMMQTTYRSTDSPPSSKIELLNEYCSNEVVPSETMCHPIECNPSENPFKVQYVRTGNVPAGDTQLMYDLGVTHVAVSGQQTTGSVIGDLWITYEVELRKPIVNSNSTYLTRSAYGTSGLVSTTTWFSNSTSISGNLGITIPSPNTFVFPKGSVGTWMITYRALNTLGVFTSWNLTGSPSLVGCTLNTTYPIIASQGSNNEAYIARVLYVTITDPALTPSVTLPLPTYTNTGSGVEPAFIITQVAD